MKVTITQSKLKRLKRGENKIDCQLSLVACAWYAAYISMSQTSISSEICTITVLYIYRAMLSVNITKRVWVVLCAPSCQHLQSLPITASNSVVLVYQIKNRKLDIIKIEFWPHGHYSTKLVTRSTQLVRWQYDKFNFASSIKNILNCKIF